MTACHTSTPGPVAAASGRVAMGLGLLGALGLLAVYFGLLTLLSGWAFMLDQLRRFWPYIAALSFGFGLQVGLFATLHRTLHSGGSGKVVAATGTASGFAMLSCCAHYLVGLLPALGATGLVAFIADYQVELFWFGLAANFIGILFIGRRLAAVKRAAAVLAAVLAVAVLWPPPGALAGSLPPQVNKEGNVTVKVTPLGLGAEGWRFEVTFDTHMVALDHDLRAIAVLAPPDGREVKPIAWEGDPPGGHHRKGVLVFPPVTPPPSAMTIRIRDVGPVAERSFTWQIPAGEESRKP